jgi:F420-dependent oxidoreductase-like protein
VIEQMHGIPFERPAQHVREYVEILRSAGEGTGHVDFKGELFSIDSIYGTPGAGPMPILVGALGPLMLRAAGEVADGTIATWSDEVAIERVIVPTITAAAAGAGRPAPRVGAVVPVAVTDDEDTARAAAAETFAIYDSLPRYQRMVGLGGCERAADVCAIGSERKVRDRLRGFAAAGLTDFLAAPFAFGDDPEGSRQRTLQSLADLAASL